MNQVSLLRRLASPLLVLPMLIGSLALGAAPADAADEQTASPADVAAGLKKIQSTAEGVARAAGADEAKAEQLLDGIEPAWDKIEAAVKEKDENAYLQLEEGFTLLKIGVRSADGDKAKKAAGDLAATVTSYLDKNPAPAGAAAAEAAAAAGERSAAAADTPENPLPRTGSTATLLTAMAGLALGLGGLATIAGRGAPADGSARQNSA